MSVAAKVRRAPLRLAAGAHILNSGVSRFGADDVAAKALHSVAADSLPIVDKIQPKSFARAVAIGEITLGAALLAPVVPTVVAGAGLTAFAGSVLTLWWRAPGRHRAADPRTAEQGMPTVKDVWMLGTGLSLFLDSLTNTPHDKGVAVSAKVHEKAATKRRQARRARRAAAIASSDAIGQTREFATHAREAAAVAAAHAREAAVVTAAHARDAASQVGTKVQDAVS